MKHFSIAIALGCLTAAAAVAEPYFIHELSPYWAGNEAQYNGRFYWDVTNASVQADFDIPAGWVIDKTSVQGDGGPEFALWETNTLMLTSQYLTANPLRFSFWMSVPADATGTHHVTANLYYSNDSAPGEVVQLAAVPTEATNGPTHHGPWMHTADWRTSTTWLRGNWKLDTTEVNRCLAYWRNTAGYHVDTNTPDGFAQGAGATNSMPHDADYRTSPSVTNVANWKIDTTEVNRVLSYWRNPYWYHVDLSTVDGYASGTSTAWNTTSTSTSSTTTTTSSSSTTSTSTTTTTPDTTTSTTTTPDTTTTSTTTVVTTTVVTTTSTATTPDTSTSSTTSTSTTTTTVTATTPDTTTTTSTTSTTTTAAWLLGGGVSVPWTGKEARVFTASGDSTLIVSNACTLNYVVVSCGGSGGVGTEEDFFHGGGGGGGGVLYGTTNITGAKSIAVTVGLHGGAGGANSKLGSIMPTHGGNGGSSDVAAAEAGGSGGGGCSYLSGNDGVSGQGEGGGGGGEATAGGGGGATAAGSAGGDLASDAGGNGGAGYTFAVAGTNVVVGSGGGGSGWNAGTGGTGAGNGFKEQTTQVQATSGVANRGGGGGGTMNTKTPGTGGTGCVWVWRTRE